jgi:hypothetical protein
MQRQSIVKQILIGGFFGFLIASIHALGGSDPDPIWSQHGISRLIEGAVGGALIYVAAHRALSRKK